MLSIEGIYQSKLQQFHSVAETGAARLGTDSGVFSDILTAIEDRLSLSGPSSADAASEADPTLAVSQSNGDIDAAVQAAAKATGLDSDLIRAVIQVESSFRTDAVSGSGAQGLMQLMSGTAKEMGVDDPFNAYANVMGGAGYLKKLMNRFGDVRLALAAYNTGQGRVASLDITDPDDSDQYSRISSGVRGYVDKVMRYYTQFKND